MRSWTPPTAELVNRTVALLLHAEKRRHFFDNLNNPLWVNALAEKGFFKSPPHPTTDQDNRTVGFPLWPEGSYLARMAKDVPGDVLRIIERVPKTENVRVHEGFVDAALAMPAEVAANLVGLIKKCVLTPYSPMMPEKTGQLMVKLAREGEVSPALKLARTLLAVRLSPSREVARAKQDSGFHFPPEPESYFSTWDYGEIIRLHVPALVEATGERALEVLCDALNAAVTISRSDADAAKPMDHSYIWRQTIQGAADYERNDVLTYLVDAVRDAAKGLVFSDKTLFRSIIQMLEAREWHVFQRLALHTLAEFPQVAPDLVAERLIDRAFFDEVGVRHEYAALLGVSFSSLTAEQQATILGWIERGPRCGAKPSAPKVHRRGVDRGRISSNRSLLET